MTSRYRSVAICAILAGLTIVPEPAASFEVASSTWLNVRSGPGRNFNVVGTLAPGELVEVTQCDSNRWCFITRDGPEGWVSSNLLAAAPGSSPSGAECTLEFGRGTGGPPGLSVSCADGTVIMMTDQPASEAPAPVAAAPTETPAPAPAATPEPVAAPEPTNQPVATATATPGRVGEEPRVCFYVNANFSGPQFCTGPGQVEALNPVFNNKISSVRTYGGAQARLCVDQALEGSCLTVTGDTANLDASVADLISSIDVTEAN